MEIPCKKIIEVSVFGHCSYLIYTAAIIISAAMLFREADNENQQTIEIAIMLNSFVGIVLFSMLFLLAVVCFKNPNYTAYTAIIANVSIFLMSLIIVILVEFTDICDCKRYQIIIALSGLILSSIIIMIMLIIIIYYTEEHTCVVVQKNTNTQKSPLINHPINPPYTYIKNNEFNTTPASISSRTNRTFGST